MFRKTKIICTLGPATDREGIMEQLIETGMNVARFNFSHGGHEDHRRRFLELKKLRNKLKKPVAALLDTKGPEIRVRDFENGRIVLVSGEEFTLTTREIMGNEKEVSITYDGLVKDVSSGDRILLDDGLLELQVKEVSDTDIVCEVIIGGPLSNHKGINVPGISLSLPYISESDEKDLLFGIETGFDFVAASFVRSARDVEEIRKLLDSHGGEAIQIISKIENKEGVDNIDEILKVSDGIMIARGDMGVEIPLEDVPAIQKKLIQKCYASGKVAITATQMLESMVQHPRPTRAEATDVANAIYDGTSAIMLSGETAAGKYPVESLATMVRIALHTENDINYEKRFCLHEWDEKSHSITDAISHATCSTAHDLNAAAIITVTKSGSTAHMISKYRPACPIIGCSTAVKVCRQLNLRWGVIPVQTKEEEDTFELFEHSLEEAVNQGVLKNGDIAVITAGLPLGMSGTTNLINVHVVGEPY